MPTELAHLERLRARLDENDAATTALTTGLTPAQLLWRPAPDRWGIADCFEHLIATGAAYLPRVSAALAASPAHATPDAEREYRPTWFGRMFVRASAPGGRPIRTRGPFIPPPAAADAPARFLAQQATLRELLASAAGHDLRAIRIRSPLSRLLTLRLGECLELLVVHEQRHIQQAERVREAPGFPMPAA
ncbi:MAG TPA: DinB family protein [Gemmatimonadaceae bacterium]